jgi:hypothetical protein
VAGTFSGLGPEPPGDAVLTVYGEDGEHRLPAIDGDGAPPSDGAGWTAAFAWLEAPVAFDRARLELGPGLAVDLPAGVASTNGDPLPVEVLDDGVEVDAPAPHSPPAATDVDAAAERLRLETQLLEETEELEQARTAARQAEEALQRVQADLAAEREGRAADAERFREGLASVRESAEQALAAAARARARAEDQARGEIESLQARIAELEPAGAALEVTRTELAGAREELEAVRGALAAARAGALELVDRLSEHATEGR